jgi:hypothetical protein
MPMTADSCGQRDTATLTTYLKKRSQGRVRQMMLRGQCVSARGVTGEGGSANVDVDTR